jgi:xanthosine utilization system XapX-like protein
MNWPPRWKNNTIPLLIAIAAGLVGVFVGDLLVPFTRFISA